MKRLPSWIKIRMRTDGNYASMSRALGAGRLHTVCESAHCPNQSECFNRGTATVMILGDVCTRHCRFCAVASGAPAPADPDEPRRVAEWAAQMGLRHVVVTSVTRDDLPDGGAGIFADTVRRLHTVAGVTVEVLTPDFHGNRRDILTVLAAGPDVFNHNLETVKRLQPALRPQADYRRSLDVLGVAAGHSPAVKVKSGIMVGLGETDAELREALPDLLTAGCAYLTIGQYLAPSRQHVPVERYVTPDVFTQYRETALAMGFKGVASGPLVRSSYRAEAMFKESSSVG